MGARGASTGGGPARLGSSPRSGTKSTLVCNSLMCTLDRSRDGGPGHRAAATGAASAAAATAATACLSHFASCAGERGRRRWGATTAEDLNWS